VLVEAPLVQVLVVLVVLRMELFLLNLVLHINCLSEQAVVVEREIAMLVLVERGQEFNFNQTQLQLL
jgi:hypothetical protein